MTDHNEHDDFGHIEMEEGENPAPSGFRGNLTEAWRTKPLFKLFVVLIVLGSVVAVVSSMLGPTRQTDASANISTPPDIHEPSGGTMTPYFKQQNDLANKKRAEEALKTGGSAMETIQGRVTNLDDMRKTDALNELKAETENLKKKLVQVEQKQQQPVVVPQQQQVNRSAQADAQADDNLAAAMQHQMNALQDQWKAHGIRAVGVSSPDVPSYSGIAQTSLTTGVAGATTGAAASTTPDATTLPPKIIIAAGTVNYGQLLTEANSDVPGPILVQIMSGPFAGARAVGSFQTKNEYLVLHFSLVNFDGKDYSIDAYALDPNTTLAGMATEVDERYFVRVVLPAAAGFLDGLGSALAQGDTSVTTNGSVTITTQGSQGFKQGMYRGLGEAANTAGTFFRDQANQTKPLVRVASGTPMGLFFVNSVKDTDANRKPEPTTANNINNPLASLRQMMGYPGTVVPGYGVTTSTGETPTYSPANTPTYGNSYGNAYGSNTGLGVPSYPGMSRY